MNEVELLELVSAEAANTALLLDFDGTLAPIVEKPEDARLSEGEVERLHRLSLHLGTLAVVSGRPGHFLVERLYGGRRQPSRLLAFGRGGLDTITAAGELRAAAGFDRWSGVLSSLAEEARSLSPGAFVEEKGAVLTLHWRRSPKDEELLRHFGDEAVERHGLCERGGKMSLELFPRTVPTKASVVSSLLDNHSVVAFVGDDVSDLEAFDALDRCPKGCIAVRVGVRGAEAPPELDQRADLMFESPAHTNAFLGQLESALA